MQMEREVAEDQWKDPLRLENAVDINQRMSRRDQPFLWHGQRLNTSCLPVQTQPKLPCQQTSLLPKLESTGQTMENTFLQDHAWLWSRDPPVTSSL